MELHSIHCSRNYIQCECGELINKQNIEAHTQEKHTPRPCKNCKISYLPDLLLSHDCPSLPKLCQFCEAEFPAAQFVEHVCICSSRTDQCPRCFKYIQIRDLEHHLEQVDCLGTRNKFEERMDRIRIEVSETFIGDPEEMEAEIMKRFVEAEDQEYAEEVYKKLMMERSPSSDSQIDSPGKVPYVPRPQENFERPSRDLEELPVFQHGLSESSYGATEEEKLMDEAILKSLQDR